MKIGKYNRINQEKYLNNFTNGLCVEELKRHKCMLKDLVEGKDVNVDN